MPHIKDSGQQVPGILQLPAPGPTWTQAWAQQYNNVLTRQLLYLQAQDGLLDNISCAGKTTTIDYDLLVTGAYCDQSYGYATPLTGATLTMGQYQQRLIINPAGTIATLTVNLPPTPLDGQLASMSTTHTISSLTVQTTDGSSLAVATMPVLTPGSAARFIYRLANTTWYPE
jgi:hypothetical protein